MKHYFSSLKKPVIKLLVFTTLLWYGHSKTFAQRPLYVSAASTSTTQNGSSWTQAFARLQDALRIALPGDSIWVAQGSYLAATSATNRNGSFVIPSGVKVFGGFFGNEKKLKDRYWSQFPTLLSGEAGVANNDADNVYHVVTLANVDSTTVLDGFMIKKGYASSDTAGVVSLRNFGGAIMITAKTGNYSAPVLRNLILEDNYGVNGGAIGMVDFQGGSTSLKLDNATFSNNRATLGGGVFKDANSKEYSFSVTNSIFKNNSSRLNGGAIYLNSVGMNHTLQLCSFMNNTATQDGGAVFTSWQGGNGKMQISACNFVENEGSDGGALEVSGQDVAAGQLSVLIQQTSFQKNRARSNEGGAILFSSIGYVETLNITESVFSENYSYNGGSGITIANSGGGTQDIKIERSSFTKNTCKAKLAGAITFSAGTFSKPKRVSIMVNNSIFNQNQGAFYLDHGADGTLTTSVNNCTFYQNGAYVCVKSFTELYNDVSYFANFYASNCLFSEATPSLHQLFYNGNSSIKNTQRYYIRNCCFNQVFADSISQSIVSSGSNIFGVDAGFMAADQGDFRLKPCSSAINKGNNRFADALGLKLDFAGTARILDGSVDLGAYEQPRYRIQLAASPDSLTCIKATNGKVQFAINGVPPYNYRWLSNGKSGTGNTGLSIGSYLFRIDDAKNCSDTITVKIPGPRPIKASFSLQPISGVGKWDGAIYLQKISGGTQPYRYRWSTGSTEPSLTGLAAGTYFLTISDDAGCEQTFTQQLKLLTSTTDFTLGNPQMNVFPNPIFNAGEAKLQYQDFTLGQYQWNWINALGQQVSTFQLHIDQSNGELRLPIAHLPPGLLYLVTQDPLGRSLHRSVIIEK
jgi:predicted outer membrane repeat protein